MRAPHGPLVANVTLLLLWVPGFGFDRQPLSVEDHRNGVVMGARNRDCHSDLVARLVYVDGRRFDNRLLCHHLQAYWTSWLGCPRVRAVRIQSTQPLSLAGRRDPYRSCSALRSRFPSAVRPLVADTPSVGLITEARVGRLRFSLRFHRSVSERC